MAVVASWSAGPLPTVVGDVTLASPGTSFWGSDEAVIQSSAAAAALRFDVTAQASTSLRMYFRTPTAWSSSAMNIVALRPTLSSAALTVALAGTGSPGQLRVGRSGGAVVQQSATGVLQLDTPYRLELRVDGTTGNGSYAIYPLGTDVAVWEGSASGIADWITSVIRVEVGRVNTTPTAPAWPIAHVVLTDTADAFVGRAAGDVDTGGGGGDPEYGFPWVFDGTFSPAPAPMPTFTGGGVGVHGRERLLVATSDGTWPGPGSLTVEQDEGAAAFVQYDLSPGVPKLHVVTWLEVPAVWPASAYGAVTLRPAGTPSATVAAVTLSGAGQPGQVRLSRDAGTTVQATPNNTIVAGGLYRFELLYDSTLSRARLGAFLAQSPVPLWDTGWHTHATFASPIGGIQFGRVTPSPTVGPLRYGRWRITDTLPDPVATGSVWLGYDPAVEGTPLDELWDGTQLLPLGPAQLWDGSALRPLTG